MKKCIKKLILIVVVTVIGTFKFSIVASAQSNLKNTLYNVIIENSSSEQSDRVYLDAQIIDWRYKSENNKMYRRQYNYSREKWIGEWELC